MLSFTYHAASLAFAIASTMSFINAVKTKLFRGDDISSFVDILNFVSGYWFVIFASTIDAFSCIRALMCHIHSFISTYPSGRSQKSWIFYGLVLFIVGRAMMLWVCALATSLDFTYFPARMLFAWL